MKWSMDTHKYISEVTRKALQIMVEHEITSESTPEEIDAVERELGNCGVYKDYESARGRVRRALFTYFKAYGCLDDSEQLTEVGRLYVENRLTIKEFSFYYILNYLYEKDDVKYYPTELILKCFYKLYEKDHSEGYITAYDFSKIVELDSVSDITDGFIEQLLEVRRNEPITVNERSIGYDVWAKMLVQAGIFKRNAKRQLISDDITLVQWILKGYERNYNTDKGILYTGVLKYLPIPKLAGTNGQVEDFLQESKALRAYLFEGIEDAVIDKYILNGDKNSFSDMKFALGLTDELRGYYKSFVGLERLVGHCLINSDNSNVRVVGDVLASIQLSEEEVLSLYQKELCIDYDLLERISNGCNVLLYGVPGSGKSWTIEHEYCKKGTNVERLVFHPDYTYSDFIGQILPNVDDEGQVSYKFTPGPFTNILADAYRNPDKEYILIIEEINRGNAPAIFGEVFQLLDRKTEIRDYDDDGYPVGTSEYGITNTNIAKIVYGDPKHKVRIPSNLSILGTMNTSDQNVFTLDTAFQRRWEMRLIENNFEHVDKNLANAEILDTGITWEVFCTQINNIIVGNNARMTSAEDKRLGAYFVHLRDLKYNQEMGNLSDGEYDDLRTKEEDKSITETEKERLDAIRNAMKQNRKFPEKVIKYLWDDAFKFNREVVFETSRFQSLEQVIRTFMFAEKMDRFAMFKENVRAAFTDPEE